MIYWRKLKSIMPTTKNYSTSKNNMEHLILHKPHGVEIADDFLKKIRSEFTNPQAFYAVKTAEDAQWRYSDKDPINIVNAYFLAPNCESVLFLDKGTHYQSKPNPIMHRINDSKYSWFLAMMTGTFSFLTPANDRCPKLIYDHFLKFLDNNSLNLFLKNLSSENKSVASVTITESGVRRYGNWHEHQGCNLSYIDFLYKIPYEVRSTIKAIAAYLTNPEGIKPEIERINKFSDHELFKFCEERPELQKILQQLS